MATMDLGARGGSGFVRLPVEERVVECTVDGDKVRPSWLAKVGERIVRCRDCRMFDGVWCEMGEFTVPHMDGGFCAWGIRKEQR